MAGDPVAGVNFPEFGHKQVAAPNTTGTPGMEGTAGGRGKRVRKIPRRTDSEGRFEGTGWLPHQGSGNPRTPKILSLDAGRSCLSNADPRGSNQLAVQDIAALQDHRDRIGGELVSWVHAKRLMKLRVKGLSERRDRLQSLVGQSLVKKLIDRLHPLGEGFRIVPHLKRGQSLLEGIEGGEKSLDKLSGGKLPRIFLVPGGPLAQIVHVGLGSGHLSLQLFVFGSQGLEGFACGGQLFERLLEETGLSHQPLGSCFTFRMKTLTPMSVIFTVGVCLNSISTRRHVLFFASCVPAVGENIPGRF